MDILNIIFLLCFIILSAGVLVTSLYVYVLFSHEKEKTFRGYKFAIAGIITSIFISFMCIMLVPFDILSDYKTSSHSTWGLHFNMDTIWKVIMIMSVITFLMNLFWLSYYRYSNSFSADQTDFELKNRIVAGLKRVFMVAGIAILIIIPLSYVAGGRVRITYKIQSASLEQLLFAQNNGPGNINNEQALMTSMYRPSRSIAMTAPIVAYGSFLLYIIGAFGMAVLPFSLIRIWLKRPMKPKADEMVMSKIILREETLEAIKKLREIIETKSEIEKMNADPNHDKYTVNSKIRNYQKELLECQDNLIKYEQMRTTNQRRHNILNENPLKYYGCFIAGLFSIFFSTLIVLHSFFMIFGYFGVLEGYFNTLQKVGMIPAIVGYILISFYLLSCIVKGYESLSYIMPQYLGYNQMKYNRTWMDTWIIVVNILLPGAWAVMAFFLQAAPNFLSFLRGGQIMSNFVTKIEYIRPFFKYHIFHWVLLTFFFVSIALNISVGLGDEELDLRIAETKGGLKNRQIRYIKENPSYR